MMRLLFRIGGWAVAALIVYSSLGPIYTRPVVSHDPHYERLLAYLLAGGLLGLGYPKHRWSVALAVAAGAVGLEVCQNFVPGRHPKLPDAFSKLAGSVIGVAAAYLLNRVWLRFERKGAKPAE